jgi:hypothetical protein
MPVAGELRARRGACGSSVLPSFAPLAREAPHCVLPGSLDGQAGKNEDRSRDGFVQSMSQAFDRLDVDKSGALERGELRQNDEVELILDVIAHPPAAL